jgi:hypothetical protein
VAKKIHKQKKVIIIALSLLAVAACVAAISIKLKQESDQAKINQVAADTSYPGKTDDAAPTGSDTIDQAKPAAQAENQGAIKSSTYDLTLVRFGQTSPGQAVEVRALVTGTSQGTCEISWSGPGTSFSRSSAITYDGRTVSCGALDTPAASFNQPGTWTFSLRAINGSSSSNTAQDKVTVTK